MIVLNKIKCNHCGDEIISHSVHDFVWCKCEKVAVDGGCEYQHLTGNPDDYTNMVIYDDAPYEIVRENFHRGGRGKSGREDLKWVPMSKMSDEWLKACIVYNKDREMGDRENKLYQKEIDYRQENNISIKE